MWRISLGIVACVWGVSVWLAYEAGRENAGYELDRTAPLRDEMEGLREMNSRLRTQISILQRTGQVDRQAKVELSREVKNTQDQQAQLRDEISFYKSMVLSDADKPGLSIYSMTVARAEGRLYHYKLVLTQSGKNDNLAQGKVKVTIKGILQGKEKNLDMGKIQVAESRRLSYKFKYFQELSGSFQLPVNYNPREVAVELVPHSGRVSNKPTKTFDWQKWSFEE